MCVCGKPSVLKQFYTCLALSEMPRYNLILSKLLGWHGGGDLTSDWPLSLSSEIWLAEDGLTGCWHLVWMSSCPPPNVLHLSPIVTQSVHWWCPRGWFICYIVNLSLIGRGRSRDLDTGLWLVDPLWPHNLSGPGLSSSSESSLAMTSFKEKISSENLIPAKPLFLIHFSYMLLFPKFNLYCKRHLGTLCCANVRMIMASYDYFWENCKKALFILNKSPNRAGCDQQSRAYKLVCFMKS